MAKEIYFAPQFVFDLRGIPGFLANVVTGVPSLKTWLMYDIMQNPEAVPG
jgi:hypothetical protein